MRVAVMIPPGANLFAVVFALLKMGAAPVLVDPGMGVKNLGQCLAEAEPEAFIGITKAQWARRLLRWGSKTLRISITVSSRRNEDSGADKPFPVESTVAKDLAAILFTSGSTGVPKGVIYTHGIFESQLRLLRKIYQIEPGEVDVPTFPLFALFAPGLGMTSIIPEMDFTRPARVNPERIREAIESHRATSMFGSPALLRRVSQAQGFHFPTIRRVITAGAPVSAKTLERFSALISPEARIVTPYGATESLPVCSIDHREILDETRALTDQGKGVCVGRAVPEMKVEIIRITDDPIPEWSDDLLLPQGGIGEITVSGPVVTPGYHQRPRSTELAKIYDPNTGTLRHRMGDLGYLDAQGRVWFCGRKSHRVVTPNQTFFTIPCEAIFNVHPGVERTALVGTPKSGVNQPVLCVELAAGCKRGREALRGELLELGARHSHTRPIKTLLFHPGFPVDVRHNAKIFREKLAVWAAKQRLG